MKEVIERCNWLINKCEDKAITPDVKDDVRYLLEEIERLNNIIDKAREYMGENIVWRYQNKFIEELDDILQGSNKGE